jgi:hypothetical protein
MATKKVSSKSESAIESVAGKIKSPITFKEFSKDPVKGLLFIVLIAIGYLYVDIKLSNKDIQDKQNTKIESLEVKVDGLTNQLRRSDSALSAAVSKINVLQELGKIK